MVKVSGVPYEVDLKPENTIEDKSIYSIEFSPAWNKWIEMKLSNRANGNYNSAELPLFDGFEGGWNSALELAIKYISKYPSPESAEIIETLKDEIRP